MTNAARESRAATRPASRALATGADVRLAIGAAAEWLERHAASVNALNVFPVPDGDTGTNMSATMRAAADAAAKTSGDSAADVLQATARGALMGARGNSGVILSQLLRGFAESSTERASLRPADLAAGFARAAEAGYASVGRPVEGTILTVARRAGEVAVEAASRTDTFSKLLDEVFRATSQAVTDTTSQLAVLRDAGVVDAGAEGYRLIVEAFLQVARGKPLEDDVIAPVASRALVAAQHLHEGGVGFCTELLIDGVTESVVTIRKYVESVGDSVIVVGDSDLVRVHVHTLKPGAAIDYAVELGVVHSVKVENMQLQHDAGLASASNDAALSDIGVVVVAPGAGFGRLFLSLGAAAVVDGGQTMNPSVQDILRAVNGVGYRELILLPNNSNIVMAAERAAAESPRTLRVVPTRFVPAGIAALLAFNYEADLDSNVELMSAASSRVVSVEVTRAVKSTRAGGFVIQLGDYLAMIDSKVASVNDDLDETALQALAQVDPESREVVAVYLGLDVSPEQGEALAGKIRAAWPGLEVEVNVGGQPHYHYILSAE